LKSERTARIETKGIPFMILTENNMTVEQEQKMLREMIRVRRSKKSYASLKKAHKAILGE